MRKTSELVHQRYFIVFQVFIVVFLVIIAAIILVNKTVNVVGAFCREARALMFFKIDLSLALCVSTPTNYNICLRSNSGISFNTWTHVTCVCTGRSIYYSNNI